MLSAPAGAGKTTRLPRALHEAGFCLRGEVVVLEPRRLATRLAATRVAEESGEKIGQTVGYTVRFEKIDSPDTRIRFVTEGILTRKIVRAPRLDGISAVVLDEFHERHLATDLSLALLRHIQRTCRPDLRLVVMSATLDTGPVARFLGDAPVLVGEGIRFPTEIEYADRVSERPLHEKVRAAVASVLHGGTAGDILVFVPGAAEIRQAAAILHSLAAEHGRVVVALHGDLPPAEQARAVRKMDRGKIVLSTNVAESSVTIPGVTVVLDSGLARVAGHSSWSGLPTTAIRKISKASAAQRAGRASRQQPGLVVRLYTRADFESRPEFDVPEIKRADLSEALLTLHGAGVRDVNGFAWFESPTAAALEHARNLLRRLGALGDSGELSHDGRRMLAFPLHPRQSRLIIEGERAGVAGDACLLAALLSERDIRLGTRTGLTPGAGRTGFRTSGHSDLIEMAERFAEAEDAGLLPGRLLEMGLEPRAAERVARARRQLVRLAHDRSRPPGTPEDREEALRIATLTGFPDRVARCRARGSRVFLLAGGGEAALSDASVVHHADLVVAVDAEERSSSDPRDAAVLIRVASAIEPEWLAALFPGRRRRGTAARVEPRSGPGGRSAAYPLRPGDPRATRPARFRNR